MERAPIRQIKLRLLLSFWKYLRSREKDKKPTAVQEIPMEYTIFTADTPMKPTALSFTVNSASWNAKKHRAKHSPCISADFVILRLFILPMSIFSTPIFKQKIFAYHSLFSIRMQTLYHEFLCFTNHTYAFLFQTSCYNYINHSFTALILKNNIDVAYAQGSSSSYLWKKNIASKQMTNSYFTFQYSNALFCHNLRNIFSKTRHFFLM